jgi:ABC-type transport system substrate-binding protein
MSDPTLGGISEKSRLLRQALQRAINTDVLASRILFGGADPLRRIFLPIAAVPNPALRDLRYSKDAAADLLQRAGFPGGRGLPVIRLITLNTDEARAVAAQIQADWGAIGVRSEYEQRDFPTLVDLVLKGKSPVTLLFIDAISLAPDYAVQFFLPDAPFNFFKYENPELGRLYAQSLRAGEESERNRIYAQMENVVLGDAPWLFLYSRRKMTLLQAGVRGYRLNALRQVDYADVSRE